MVSVAPALLVPSGDVEGLTSALRSWLTDGAERRRLRRDALVRRTDLPSWTTRSSPSTPALRSAALVGATT